MTTDIIDRLADVAPGSRVDGLRQRRAQARTNSQASSPTYPARPAS